VPYRPFNSLYWILRGRNAILEIGLISIHFQFFVLDSLLACSRLGTVDLHSFQFFVLDSREYMRELESSARYQVFQFFVLDSVVSGYVSNGSNTLYTFNSLYWIRVQLCFEAHAHLYGRVFQFFVLDSLNNFQFFVLDSKYRGRHVAPFALSILCIGFPFSLQMALSSLRIAFNSLYWIQIYS